MFAMDQTSASAATAGDCFLYTSAAKASCTLTADATVDWDYYIPSSAICDGRQDAQFARTPNAKVHIAPATQPGEKLETWAALSSVAARSALAYSGAPQQIEQQNAFYERGITTASDCAKALTSSAAGWDGFVFCTAACELAEERCMLYKGRVTKIAQLTDATAKATGKNYLVPQGGHLVGDH